MIAYGSKELELGLKCTMPDCIKIFPLKRYTQAKNHPCVQHQDREGYEDFKASLDHLN
jgi:hypothetical protein